MENEKKRKKRRGLRKSDKCTKVTKTIRYTYESQRKENQ